MKKRKKQGYEDLAYKELVEGLPCVVSDENCYGDIVAHHEDGWGTANKAPDALSLPLCCNHHCEMPVYHPKKSGYGVSFHAGKKVWERKYGTQQHHIKATQETLGYDGEYKIE